MRLKEVLEATIPGLGYELVDIEITPAKLVRVFIDKENGDITIEDCEVVSNHLNRLFLVENIDYNRLEISSPGLERPLKKLGDFIKFKGKLAKVKTRELIDNQKVFQGTITDVNAEVIVLELDNGLTQTIDFNNINKARLVFEDKKKSKKVKK